MRHRYWLAVLAATLVASCERKPAAEAPHSAPPPAPVQATVLPPAGLPPVEPRAPGSPGALPDDRTPVSEARFSPTSAQGAADVIQRYFGYLEFRRYGEAQALWSDGGRASGLTPQAFADRFLAYDSYHGLVGAPGAIEGAAGSLYVEVPVQVYGRRKDGREFHESGTATLRRVNNVPGSTAEQRTWRITAMDLRSAPN